MTERPEEGVRSLGAGVTGGCEPPNLGAGNLTLLLGKSIVGAMLLVLFCMCTAGAGTPCLGYVWQVLFQ